MPRQPNKPVRRRKLTAAQFTARYKAERIVLQRRYCAAFALWQNCAHPRCHRACACMGDAGTCLKRALSTVPHAVQWQARQQILAATPHNIGAPERAARQCMPLDLYIGTTAQAAADYLARFKAKPSSGAG
jgi:hypothetical protein